METSAREMVNIEETFAREGSLSFPLFSYPKLSNEERIDIVQWSMIVDVCLIPYAKLCPIPVIVRRVVAARQHAAGMTAAAPRGNQGLLSHAYSSTSRTQPLLPYGEKEADSSDFPERPGAKKTKRGGFWARFKCW